MKQVEPSKTGIVCVCFAGQNVFPVRSGIRESIRKTAKSSLTVEEPPQTSRKGTTQSGFGLKGFRVWSPFEINLLELFHRTKDQTCWNKRVLLPPRSTADHDQPDIDGFDLRARGGRWLFCFKCVFPLMVVLLLLLIGFFVLRFPHVFLGFGVLGFVFWFSSGCSWFSCCPLWFPPNDPWV